MPRAQQYKFLYYYIFYLLCEKVKGKMAILGGGHRSD